MAWAEKLPSAVEREEMIRQIFSKWSSLGVKKAEAAVAAVKKSSLPAEKIQEILTPPGGPKK